MGKPYRLLDADATAAERRMIMPKNVVCKKCNNLVNDWCEKVIDSPDTDMQRDCRYFCEKTNADRIRSMTDYELKEFICSILQCKFCKFEGWGGCELLEWLQQPPKGE